MPSSEPLRILISYARKDGAALAQRLQADFAKEGLDAWLDTQRVSGGATWSTEIEHEIDTRPVTIALLSPGSCTSEICRAEQLRALDKGKRVIPVLAAKGAERPLYLYARQYRDLTDDANYALQFRELVADIRGEATATLPDTYRKTRVTYRTAPPRIADYLERPEALHAHAETGVLVAAFTCDAPVDCCAIIGHDKVICGDVGGRVHFLGLEEAKRKE